MRVPENFETRQHVASLLAFIAERQHEWVEPTIVFVIRNAFASLETYLTDPQVSDISWQKPFAEIHHQAPGEWTLYQPGNEHFGVQDWPDCFADLLVNLDTSAWPDLIVRLMIHEVLQRLMKNAGLLVRRGEISTLLPEREHYAIAFKNDSEQADELARMYQPFPIDIDGSIELIRTGHPTLSIFPSIEIRPFVVDEDKEQSYIPLIVGFRSTTYDGDIAELPNLNADDAAELWEALAKLNEREVLEDLHAAIARIIAEYGTSAA